MKTKTPHILTLGAALLLAPLTSTLAQSTWETTDALMPYSGRAIVADASGDFITLSVPTNSTTTPVSTVVSVSTDTGLAWQTAGTIPGYALKLTAAPDGTLYASGNLTGRGGDKPFVWFSRDHGTNWTVSDPWAGQTNTLYVTDLAAGNSGAVYACGLYATPRWFVRKGVLNAAGGITWTTVDNNINGDAQSISVRPGAASQPDQIFVCGEAPSLSGWAVRRSTDGGATWSTVDANTLANAYSVAAGADGSIYAIGKYLKAVKNGYQSGWIVRKSSDNGTTWSTVDSVPNVFPAFGSSLRVDAFGRVFAVGFTLTTPETWLVRGSADGGATWTNTDIFLPAGYTSAQAMGAASDALGNVCVIGDVENGTPSANLAPVRRLAAP
jgi:hypothetical protein